MDTANCLWLDAGQGVRPSLGFICVAPAIKAEAGTALLAAARREAESHRDE